MTCFNRMMNYFYCIYCLRGRCRRRRLPSGCRTRPSISCCRLWKRHRPTAAWVIITSCFRLTASLRVYASLHHLVFMSHCITSCLRLTASLPVYFSLHHFLFTLWISLMSDLFAFVCFQIYNKVQDKLDDYHKLVAQTTKRRLVTR